MKPRKLTLEETMRNVPMGTDDLVGKRIRVIGWDFQIKGRLEKCNFAVTSMPPVKGYKLHFSNGLLEFPEYLVDRIQIKGNEIRLRLKR